jgi:hypothetical protein
LNIIDTVRYGKLGYEGFLHGAWSNLSFARFVIHNAASKGISPDSPNRDKLARPRHECSGSDLTANSKRENVPGNAFSDFPNPPNFGCCVRDRRYTLFNPAEIYCSPSRI